MDRLGPTDRGGPRVLLDRAGRDGARTPAVPAGRPAPRPGRGRAGARPGAGGIPERGVVRAAERRLGIFARAAVPVRHGGCRSPGGARHVLLERVGRSGEGHPAGGEVPPRPRAGLVREDGGGSVAHRAGAPGGRLGGGAMGPRGRVHGRRRALGPAFGGLRSTLGGDDGAVPGAPRSNVVTPAEAPDRAALEGKVWAALSAVPDPEIPPCSITDLGIVE